MLQDSFSPHACRLTGRIAKIVFVLWIVAQVIVCVYYWGHPQFSDAEIYRRLARECLDAHTWYPMASHFVSEPYIFNPGYVNYLISVHRVFDTFEAVAWLNILMNTALAIFVSIFVRRQLGKVYGNISIILFCLLWSNLIIVAPNMTELPFSFLTYGSLALLVSINVGGEFTVKKASGLLLAGALLGLSNYIRPIALLFLIPSLLYIIFSKGRRLKSLACYLGGTVAVSLLICTFSYHLNGQFSVAASTSGVNLIMGANDDADGSYCGKVFEPGKIGNLSDYKGELNVYSRDSIYKSRSIEWIKENKMTYLKLMPKKIFRLWLGDDYQRITFNKDHNTGNDVPQITRIREIAVYSLGYYVVFILAVVSIFSMWRLMWGRPGLWLLPILAACCMHALMYGGMRYHYPYIPLLIFYASIPVGRLIRKKL